MNSSVKLVVCFLLLSFSVAQAEIITTGYVDPTDPDDWDENTFALIGNTEDGTLTVNEGSDIYTKSGFLGCHPDGFDFKGTVTISSFGTTWNNSEDFYIGYTTRGELNITNNGTVSCHNSYLGYNNNSTGTTYVSGSGSAWENSGDLAVGFFGNGELTITENGLVQVGNTLTIDGNGYGNSFINMATGGMLTIAGEVDGSLTEFYNLILGTGAIRWWDPSIGKWALLTTATPATNYTLEYLYNGYTRLTVNSPHIPSDIPGDANGDGRVDGSDVTILADNWQVLTGATRAMGDFNGDGAVDGSDVTILADNWQTGVSHAATAVPEPGTLLLSFLGLLSLGIIWRIK